MSSSVGKYTCIALFLAALVVPGLMLLTQPSQSVSLTERRELAPPPEFSWGLHKLLELPAQIDAYASDHFGFRRELIHWFNRIRILWFGISTSSIVLVGADGWLYQTGNPHIRDMRNGWPFAPWELEHWAQVLSAKNEWLRQRGIHYLFVAAPNKHLVYPEHLPGSVKMISRRSRLDQLIDHLREHTDVPVLDLRPALESARAQRRLYHKTDTHWNDLGAYVAYGAIMERLLPRLPQTRTLELASEDFVTRRAPGGDLAQALEMQAILEETLVEPATPVHECAAYPEFPQIPDVETKHRQAFTTTCPGAGHRVLMFRDSYSLALMPYLSESFGYIHYVPQSPSNFEYMKELVLQHEPDLVIDQRASRWLRTPEG